MYDYLNIPTVPEGRGLKSRAIHTRNNNKKKKKKLKYSKSRNL